MDDNDVDTLMYKGKADKVSWFRGEINSNVFSPEAYKYATALYLFTALTSFSTSKAGIRFKDIFRELIENGDVSEHFACFGYLVFGLVVDTHVSWHCFVCVEVVQFSKPFSVCCL